MSEFETMLDRYADLTVRGGINLQPGQVLMIGGPSAVSTEAVDFVRRLTRAAYDAGASRVHVYWEDPQVNRLTLERATDEALAVYPAPVARWFEELAEEGAAFLTVVAPNPELLAGVDPKRVTMATRARQQALAKVSRYTSSGRVSWCVVAVPTVDWAAKLFPELPAAEGISRLWEYVLQATRASGDDPVQAWQAHLERLNQRKEYLNQRRFKRLHLTAPGTDLIVDLSDLHQWICVGGTTNGRGVPFAPNIPSEEVFTAPLREGVNGTVTATLPLQYAGTVIEGIKRSSAAGLSSIRPPLATRRLRGSLRRMRALTTWARSLWCPWSRRSIKPESCSTTRSLTRTPPATWPSGAPIRSACRAVPG